MLDLIIKLLNLLYIQKLFIKGYNKANFSIVYLISLIISNIT